MVCVKRMHGRLGTRLLLQEMADSGVGVSTSTDVCWGAHFEEKHERGCEAPRGTGLGLLETTDLSGCGCGLVCTEAGDAQKGCGRFLIT